MDSFQLFFYGSEYSFLSYLVTYLVFLSAIVIAFLIGFALRKNKNKKLAIQSGTAAEESSSGNITAA
ncbi:MAG: hypothetical protein K5987_00105 [Lachnospiraceae bacterium]|nr:hypothetical protein [Lachnospiraceae bacterium]MCR4936548.1 hypothetical protein [Lachnospiraceae bacterium]